MRTKFKLKDYKQLEVNRIYYFDNMQLVWDGHRLMSHYPLYESMWYPFDEDEWFNKWKDKRLYSTDKYTNWRCDCIV